MMQIFKTIINQTLPILTIKADTDPLLNATSTVTVNAINEMINESIKILVDVFKETLSSSKMSEEIQKSTFGFYKSINVKNLLNILYTTEVYAQLYKIACMLFDDINNSEFKILCNNKEFISRLGPWEQIFHKYRKERETSKTNAVKFWSVLLTGMPGTGKTLFMQMVHYLGILINKYIFKTKQKTLLFFITGSFLLSQENETSSMKAFISYLESLVAKGYTVILNADEGELLFRSKINAPAVTLFLEFLSRMRVTTQIQKGKLIILCATNYGFSFDQSAYRRFIAICMFNYINPESLLNDFILKLEVLLKNSSTKKVIQNILSDKILPELIEEFIKLNSNITYGDNQNIIAHIELYIDMYKNLVQEHYILIVLFAMFDFLKKSAVLQNQHDIAFVENKANRLCDILTRYYSKHHKKQVNFRILVDLWLDYNATTTQDWDKIFKQHIDELFPADHIIEVI